MSTLNGDGEFFSGLRDWGVWFISKMFEGLGVLLRTTFGTVWVSLCACLAFFVCLARLMNSVFHSLQTLSLSTSDGSAAAAGHGLSSAGQAAGSVVLVLLEKANYVFPMAELFELGYIMAGLAIGCYTYRFLKSWIPTIS